MVQGRMVVFMILYVDDILLIINGVGPLSLVKIWLSTKFQVKDLGKVYCILGIKVLRDHKNRKPTLSQATYIEKFLVKYVMWNSKKGLFLSCMEFLFSQINVLRHLWRKSACKQYLMPQQCKTCMRCYVLDQIFAFQQTW